jgi:ABC-type uncharacterized transport system substrate-binding protein
MKGEEFKGVSIRAEFISSYLVDHERAQALVVLEEPINAACRKQIAELASARRLPTVFAREQVDAGGLISYGTSFREAAKHMAVYADKILKGASPATYQSKPRCDTSLLLT